jgi:LPXTG-motif cell wall-anchored protein
VVFTEGDKKHLSVRYESQKVITMRRQSRLGLRVVALSGLLTSVAFISPNAAHAIGATYGLDYYISAPMVQGTFVAGATKENFDALSTGNCPSTVGNGSITVSGNVCEVKVVDTYGGASSDGDTPTAGGSGSLYAFANEAGTTFSLTTSQCYLGFWWSAGSNGNTVEFFSAGELVLSLDSDSIISILDPSIEPTLQSVDGTTYQKASWFGNPRGHEDNNNDGLPDGLSTENDGEPYVYLNIIGKGGLFFDSVTFSGSNFEFDNLAFSAACPTPPSSSVFLGYVGEGESESPRSPIHPDYLQRKIDEVAELPNTGRTSSHLGWLAVVLMGAGASAFGIRRRAAH